MMMTMKIAIQNTIMIAWRGKIDLKIIGVYILYFFNFFNLNETNRYEGLQSEVVINYYKQQLSPILEESEDETCKTFVLNETKCLDSTR